jgi:hypothetical protein
MLPVVWQEAFVVKITKFEFKVGDLPRAIINGIQNF